MEKKKKVKNGYDDSWMYILLLTTLTILAYSLTTYTFKIWNLHLTYSLFLLPALFMLTDYIAKKYGYKKAVNGILVSSFSMIMFIVIMTVIVSKDITFGSFAGHFSALVIAQLFNLTIYSFLLNNTSLTYILVFINNLFSLVIFYLNFTLLNLNTINIDGYWKGYFLTLLIQIPICLLLSYFDIKTKRGIEE